MLKSKSHSFNEKINPSKKTPVVPLLEVFYNQIPLKSTSLETIDQISKDLTTDKFKELDNSGDLDGKDNFNDLIEQEKNLLSEKIFQELCQNNGFSVEKHCNVCGTKFNFVNNKKNCAFCGEAVCGDHSEKKRANPKNNAEFLRICDFCERKYLEKMIYQEFLKKKSAKNKVVFDAETQLKKAKDEMMEKQKEIFLLNTQV